MNTKAYYDARDEMFVVELCDAKELQKKRSRKGEWGMFVHGVCFHYVNGAYNFYTIGVTEGHSTAGDINLEGTDEQAQLLLQDRLVRLIQRLRQQVSNEPHLKYPELFLSIAQTLEEQKEDLSEQWIKSWQEQNR